MRTELADFFCEDRDTFKLEECFKLFLGFCQRFRTGVLENEHRKQQEAAADVRRKQREEQLALKRRQSGGQTGSTGGGDTDVMDSLLLDIRCGFPMRDKFRKGGPAKKSNAADVVQEDDQASPLVMAVASSPRVSRKRLGSNSAVAVPGIVSDKTDETLLPGKKKTAKVPPDNDDVTCRAVLFVPPQRT